MAKCINKDHQCKPIFVQLIIKGRLINQFCPLQRHSDVGGGGGVPEMIFSDFFYYVKT